MTNSIEKYTGELFGGLWQNLTDEQFRSSVELFTNRAIENKFDQDGYRKDLIKQIKKYEPEFNEVYLSTNNLEEKLGQLEK